MGVLSAVKKLTIGPTTLSEIREAMEAERLKIAATKVESARLQTLLSSEEDFDAAEGINSKLRHQGHIARIAEGKLEDFSRQLSKAKGDQQHAAIGRHAARIDATARQLMKSLGTSASLNTSLQKQFEEARRELSDGIACAYLKSVIFNGLVREDLVESWAKDTERNLEGVKAKVSRITQPIIGYPGTRTNEVPTIVKAATPTPRNEPRIGRVLPAAPMDTAQTKARRTPDDLSPLKPGEARVKVVRYGYAPADDRPAAAYGQIVRMPAATALRAQDNGAVEIIESGMSTVAAQEK